MPVPRFQARINKRVFNKIELKKGVRPVLIHKGRASGKTFETPLDAHKVEGGYVFIVMYGPKSDWVKNILKAGSATLRVENKMYELDNPKLLTKEEAVKELSPDVKTPPDFLRVDDYLKMNLVK